jgi:hypothetical protein
VSAIKASAIREDKMMQMAWYKLAAIGLGFGLVLPANAATTLFTDNFSTLNYDYTEYGTAGYVTGFSHYNSGGNRSLRWTYDRFGANPVGLRMQALSETFIYDPGVSGVITSIDASLAQSYYLYANGNALTLSTTTNRLRLLAQQDGVLYEATYDAGTPVGTYGVYTTVSKFGFVASDFLRFDPANPNAARTLTGLDFAGSAITFGFEITPNGVQYSNGTPYDGRSIWISNFDDFAVAVNHDDPIVGDAVPEPAQWALLIGGFALTGTAARRRREEKFAHA